MGPLFTKWTGWLSVLHCLHSCILHIPVFGFPYQLIYWQPLPEMLWECTDSVFIVLPVGDSKANSCRMRRTRRIDRFLVLCDLCEALLTEFLLAAHTQTCRERRSRLYSPRATADFFLSPAAACVWRLRTDICGAAGTCGCSTSTRLVRKQ